MAGGKGGLWSRLFEDPELLWLFLGLVILILAGIAGIIGAKSWRKSSSAELPPEDELESYRTLLHQGLLQPEEFEKIQSRLENPNIPDPGNPAPSDDLSTGKTRPPGNSPGPAA